MADWARRRGYRMGNPRRKKSNRQTIRQLLAESLERRMLLTTVISVDPPADSHDAAAAAEVVAGFDRMLNPGTVSTETFKVHSTFRGELSGGVSASGSTAMFAPVQGFLPGELLQSTVTPGIQSSTGLPASPHVWQFRAAVGGGSGVFLEDGQQVGDGNGIAVALGDFDGDGDLDGFVANSAEANRVWINNGGVFADSGQGLGDHNSVAVALGDVDSDGDLDAFVANTNEGNRVWLNTSGIFVDSGQSIGAFDSFSVALGDVDGDGDVDAFVANRLQGNKVWLNEAGVFTDSDQSLGNHSSYSVSLGDVDGDGDLDAVVANAYEANRVWLNAGGIFTDSGQTLGNNESLGLSLGDVDGDGDLDAFVANYYQGNRVWLNNGSGQFVDSGQSLGDHASYSVALGDLDADGDLDAFVVNSYQSNRVWLNDGGLFSGSGQLLGQHDSSGIALGDVDLDGDLDAVVANFGQANRVWINQNPTLSVSPQRVVAAEGNSGTAAFTFHVRREFDTTGSVSVDYRFAPSGSNPADAADIAGGVFSSGTLVFVDGVGSMPLSLEVVGDTGVERDETFQLVLSNPIGRGATVTNAVASGVIRNDDNVDAGDLPGPFPTLLAANGAAHTATGPTLGLARDTEPDGQPTANADGDDAGGDEDGIVIDSLVFPGQLAAQLTVHVSGDARLDGWIDFDGDDSLAAADEQIFKSRTVTAGRNILHYAVPADARVGQTFARFRLSTAGSLAPGGGAADGEVEDYSLVIAPPFGSGILSDSQQVLGTQSTAAVALGDLDGDGDQDALAATSDGTGSTVWLNADGLFFDSGQRLGATSSSSVALGDIDEDGDLDAIVGSLNSGNRLWLNSGGIFSDSGQSLGDHETYGLALGDLDGDGDLDLFTANGGDGNRVWLNESGVFVGSGQLLGMSDSRDVALGDLDGDGDLDAFVTNTGQGNRVWLNDAGRFSDSGQALGNHQSFSAALGDLDGDGDLDAFVSNDAQANRVWLNSGGVFTDTGQSLGNQNSGRSALGDLDGDGDLDAFVPNENQVDRIWFNNSAVFTNSGQSVGYVSGVGVALGDLDGDGDLDAFVAGYDSADGNRVVLDNGNRSLFAVSATDAARPEGDSGLTSFTFEVTRTGNLALAGSANYAVIGSGANPADAADFGGSFPSGVVNFVAGQSARTVSIQVAADANSESDEGFDVQITSAAPATAAIVTASAAGTIQNDDFSTVTVNLLAAKDNTLYETADGSLSNGAGQFLFAGRTGVAANTTLRRSLLSFDVANSGIPSGATIVGVTLTLNMNRTNSGANDVQLHRLTADWGEGASDAVGLEGPGTAAAANDATWLHTFFDTAAWTNPGGDFVAAASASSLLEEVGLYQWSGPGLVADVQGWLDNGNDFGWIIRGEEVLVGTAQRFDSRSGQTPPLLAVEYALPPAILSIAATAADTAEGNAGSTPFAFTATRSGDTSGQTTVSYAVTGSGANPAGSDDFGGTLPSGAVTFAASETSKTIVVEVSGDLEFEPDETFEVTLSNPTPALSQIATATATGTIQNDEDPLPTVTLSVDALTIPEAAGVATFTATLSGPAVLPVTVELGFSGTATFGDDYSVAGTPLVIPAGAVSGTMTVTAVQDSFDEEDETVVVDIIGVTNASEAGVQSQATMIADDDNPPQGPPVVLAVDPANAAAAAMRDATLTIDFDQNINGATVSTQTIAVHPMSQARLVGAAATLTTAAGTVSLDPHAEFLPGEPVQVTVTAGVQGFTGEGAKPHVWQFRAAAPRGSGVFSDSFQLLGSANSYRLAVGDVDGDGDLDAFVASVVEGNNLWINTNGVFADTQSLGNHNTRDVALGDLDGDGDLDAFTVNVDQANRVWRNENGVFVDSQQALGARSSVAVSLGDVDGDGDLDAFVANLNQGNRVWLNEGGQFTDSGQQFGDHTSLDVVLGDLDGDGDLDAFVVNANQANRVWLNEGGEFSDSGQLLGDSNSFAAALGDLDGDGDLDAIVANYGQSNRIWINQTGNFSDSGQALGNQNSTDIELGDFDADGDLDAFVTNAVQGNRVWQNDGGTFSDSGQSLGTHTSFGVGVGDFDGDGDIDAFVSNNNDANRVWLNQNPTFSVTPGRVLLGEGDSGSTTFTFNVNRLVDTRGTATVDYAFAPSGANPAQLEDFVGATLPSGTLVFADGVGSLQLSIETVGDTLVEADETFSVTLTNPIGSQVGVAVSTGVIRNDDNVDLGDLPDSFQTLLASNGPTHLAVGPALGAARDIESDGQPTADGSGDDNAGAPDDEDGVVFSSAFFAGQLAAAVEVTASQAAKLDAWIDFNGDGFFDRQEQIFVSRDVAAGVNPLIFTVPADSSQGQTFARFRLSTAGGLLPTGSAADGEVEDYRLTLGSPLGSAFFSDSGQGLGNHESLAVALGDFDQDGDLDAFIANQGAGNQVFLNSGGLFTDSGQLLGDHNSFGVALGDLDGDGDLDAFISNFGQGNRVWFNEGGVFSDSGQILGNHVSLEAALGDLDGDGDLDAFVANGGQANRVWINDGGQFTDSGQYLGVLNSVAVALGDLDRDGDLDAYVTNTQGSRVWLNAGGVFSDSGQVLGSGAGRDAALGDLDGDGDLDAFVANSFQADRIWINDAGNFSDSGQLLGTHDSSGVSLGDLDGDGDLDAFVATYYGSNRVWLNTNGAFAPGGQNLGSHFSSGNALGDIDGDGDLDAVVANYYQNRVWLNQNPTFSLSPLSLPRPEGNSGVSAFNFTVSRLFDTRGAASVDYAISPAAVDPAGSDDFVNGILPSGTLNFAAGESQKTITVEVIGDSEIEPDESFVVTLSNPVGVNPVIGVGTATGIIRNDDSLDLGDLPAPFRTLLVDNGPAHIGVGPLLGSLRDAEANGQPSANAEGDDTNGVADDEDGVRFGSLVFAGQLDARVTVTASGSGKLDAWIDFDGDRSFGGAGEQIFRSVNVVAGDNELSFEVPADARQGLTFARFRLSTAGGLAPTGGAVDGEVEDHSLTIANPLGSGVLTDSGQLLANHSSIAVELGDLDGDGDLDAFVANGYGEANRVWINDGGRFLSSGQALGDHSSSDVALGDLDGDGDLDAFVTNSYQNGNRVWINTGGVFTDSGQEIGANNSLGVALGDLDDDGDLDAFIANSDQGNRIWLNDGGTFTDSGQQLGNHNSFAVALGDLDGDGDLDAYVANYSQANRVWMNQGGVFTDSNQTLASQRTFDVALGDLDDDGDLDAFAVNVQDGNRVWLNTAGTFSDSGQRLGLEFSFAIALGDMDGDGDLDAFVANGDANKIWRNTGGVFADSGRDMGNHSSFGLALGDLDADGDLDAFTANYYPAQPNRVWLDDATNSLISIRATDAIHDEGNTGNTSFVFEVTRTGDVGSSTTVDFTVSGVETNPADANDFGGTFPSGIVNFAADVTSQTIVIEVSGDTALEPDERFAVTLTAPPQATTRIVAAEARGTIVDDDDVVITSFRVTSLTPTSSGFVAEFNDTLDVATLNLFDTEGGGLGPADAVLSGAAGGPIAGSLVVDPSLRSITFIKTGGPLAADDYTVALRSTANGIVSVAGSQLDGDNNGTGGDDFSASFTVAAAPANAVTVAVRDFVRGPGQDVNLPADSTSGIPVTISEGANVRSIDFLIAYDDTLLEITAVTAGATMPAGSTVSLDTTTPGLALVSFTSPVDLPAGEQVFANLIAAVPTENANAIYRSKHVLDVRSVTVLDAGANQLPVIEDDALHVSAYFGDSSGNARLNASDAARVARVAALLDSGFETFRLADPMVIGDITGNGRLNAADASRVARVAALLPVAEIPPIPGGVVSSPITGGPDPKLSLPRNLTAAAGGTITVPLELDSIFDLQAPHRLAAAGIVIAYDPEILTADAVSPGSFMSSHAEWSLIENRSEPGRIVIAAFTSDPVAGQFVDTFVNLHFTVNAGAQAGSTVINLVESAGGAETQLLDEGDGFLVLVPAVTDAADDPVDGLLEIVVDDDNAPPELTDPGDQSLTAARPVELTLVASDPDSGDLLSFATEAQSAEYYLDQTIGLQRGPGGLWENWSGRLDEKWLLGDDGVTWYFITPDGSFWRWLGGDRDIAAHSEFVASLSQAAYEDPASLYDAQRGGSAAADVSVTGDQLSIDPRDDFSGMFSVLVSVTDSGGLTDSRLVRVDVALSELEDGDELLADELLEDLAAGVLGG